MNNQLLEAKFRCERYNKLIEERKVLLDKLNQIKVLHEESCDRLEKENHDVAKLNRLSFASFWATMMQNKAGKLEKEEQEAYEALKTVKKYENEITVLKMQLDDVREELADLVHAENEYQNLLETLKNETSDETIDQLKIEYEKVGLHEKEVKEAILAGNDVLTLLLEAKDHLGSAQGWGVYDMVGGGMLATAIKHDHINTAKKGLQNLDKKMRQFAKELNDINQVSMNAFDLSGFEVFGDYLFDNLFMDWHVQGKINRMYDKVKETSKNVEALLNRLKNDVAADQQLMKEINEKIEKHILDLSR